MRGIERRIAAGRDPEDSFRCIGFHQSLGQGSDGKSSGEIEKSPGNCDREAHLQSLLRFAESARWQSSLEAGARQRLLWGSTGTKDPGART